MKRVAVKARWGKEALDLELDSLILLGLTEGKEVTAGFGVDDTPALFDALIKRCKLNPVRDDFRILLDAVLRASSAAQVLAVLETILDGEKT